MEFHEPKATIALAHDPPPVLVAVPAIDWVWTLAAESLFALRCPPGSRVAFSRGGTTLLEKRTLICEDFLRCEHFGALFFVDSDQVLAPDTLERLLSWNLPICAGLIFNRCPPHTACALVPGPHGADVRLTDFSSPHPIRVSQAPTGALLIRRAAGGQIAPPWFDWLEPGHGEDGYFSRKASAAGIPLYVDPRTVVGHVGATNVDLAYAATWRSSARLREGLTGAVEVDPDNVFTDGQAVRPSSR